MNESKLINLGYKFEKAEDTTLIRLIATQIRELLQKLDPQQQTEARKLIEIGRSEARL
jgi:hypothetical protein